MQAPSRSGSTYFNYKGFHSIVLLAVCDANYRFIVVYIGDAGWHSDGGVLSNSTFGQVLESNLLSISPPAALPGTPTKAPFAFIG